MIYGRQIGYMKQSLYTKFLSFLVRNCFYYITSKIAIVLLEVDESTILYMY